LDAARRCNRLIELEGGRLVAAAGDAARG